jgi:hypothetical protein
VLSRWTTLIGLIVTRRAFSPPAAPHEMKSNFAPVSLELRAPIARCGSWLKICERGKVNEPARQRVLFPVNRTGMSAALG